MFPKEFTKYAGVQVAIATKFTPKSLNRPIRTK